MSPYWDSNGEREKPREALVGKGSCRNYNSARAEEAASLKDVELDPLESKQIRLRATPHQEARWLAESFVTTRLLC